ncbi:MAG: 60S ribosomal export protein NMD3 [Methanoregula sp.]
MSIQDRFCPKCGKPTENDGLCSDCLVGSTKWFTCDPRALSTHCPSCGAIKVGNTWTDSSKERSDLAPDLARSAVHLHPDVKNATIDVSIIDISQNRSRASLVIRGQLYKKFVEDTCKVELVWHKEQCDRCNRISGSYYEGVVQVRADGRIPSTYEMQMTMSIAQQVEDNLQSGGERLSFISDMNEIHDGIDIILGSQHIGVLICKALIAQLGGRYTTHPKLVGEKNGRQLFRITYSMRFPRFQKYDVILSKGKYAEVERVESNHIRVMDLAEGNFHAIKDDDVERLIGNSRDSRQALVVFSDKDVIGILDPATNHTREFKKLAWMCARPGDHLNILYDGEQIVVVR